MRDLIRLIAIIVLLPVLILLIGPLLVLAAVRGRQQVGPISLDSSRYQAGLMLGVGLILWLLVWGSLGWLVYSATGAGPAVVEAPPADTAAGQTPAPTATPLDEPAVAPPTSSPTAAAPTSTPTAAPFGENDPPTPAPAATRPTAAAQTTPQPVEPEEPDATLAPADRQAALRTIDEANDLLRQAIVRGDEESLADLSSLWAGSALTSIERFARQAHDRFTQPVIVEYEYIAPPTVGEQTSADQLLITAREKWRYDSPLDSEEESFLFDYTLGLNDDGWVIMDYTYQNLARLTPTPVASPDETPTP